MQAELTLSLAFMAGLAGAGHCWAMCGGLVGGVFFNAGRGDGRYFDRPSFYGLPHVAYHAGRVLAYTLLGALAAAMGKAIVLTGGVGRAQGLLYIVAGLLTVLSGVWSLRPPVRCAECGVKPGLVRRFALLYPLAGFLNGLMPCALVFSLTMKAATAPSIATGAAWLLVFGLGTVPAMAFAAALAHGFGAQSFTWLRRAAGLLLVGLGLQAIQAGSKFFNVMLHL